MNLLKKYIAVASCASLLGFVACSDDDSAERPENLGPIAGDTIVVVDSITGESSSVVVQQDSVRHIDPITGDTIYLVDTVYIPTDTTLKWVGNSALVITEIAPINLNWLDDTGEDPGWVEIYNAGDVAANLKGYSLVENLENPRKWVFDDELIAAKSFRTVFCDKKNITMAQAGVDSDNAHFRTHTNWKLEKNGGTVYLVDKFYSIRDSVAYPALNSGVSWGIVDGGGWKFFGEPTPEKPNNEKTAYDGMAPTFSFTGASGGFYDKEITLNPPTAEGMKVRCTKDGSVPTEESDEFNSPITIDKSMVLRCAAFKKGFLTKDIVTNSYFIGETVNMPVVAISVDSAFFREHYIKTSAQSPNEAPAGLYVDAEYPVHVEYFASGSKSKEKAWEIDAGISLMGGYSRLNDKKSVAIVMREQYQDGRLNYPLFETRKEQNSKFKAFNLRNNGNRFVSDYIEDAMGGALLEGSGVDYQRSRQVVVFYNGRYYGIHDMRERFNRHYVETNYRIDANSVEMIKQLGGEDNITASSGTIDNYISMLQFIGNNDMSVAKNYEIAKTLLDVGNFANYMIAEIYYHNGDWPNNNVRAWRSPDQPWKFMVYDLDHGFDWMWGVNGGEFRQSTDMFGWIKQGGGNHPCKAVGCFANLYNSLIKNADFKRLFLNRTAIMWQNYLNSANVTKTVDAMVATLDAGEMTRDLEKFKQTDRWYKNSCGGGFDKKGDCLKEWSISRDTKVLDEYKSEFGVSSMVSFSIAAAGNGFVLIEGTKLPGGAKYTGKFFAEIPMLLTAVATNGAIFAGWSDGATENPHLVMPAEGATITATFK